MSFDSLEQFKETVIDRFDTPRRSEINEGLGKDDLLQSLIDLATFVSETNSSEFIQGKITEIIGLVQNMDQVASNVDSLYLATKTEREQSALNAINAALSELNAAMYGTGSQVAQPSDVPAANVKLYNVGTAGTYANFSGIVVSAADLNSGVVQLMQTAGVWNKRIVPIALTAYSQKSELQTTKETIVLTTEAGYYDALGAKAASASFTRSVSLINISGFDWLYYTGQMGGMAPVAVCWFNGNTFISSQKLSPGDGSNQTFADYQLTKPATATHIALTFRSDNSVAFSFKGNRTSYTKLNETDAAKARISAAETVINDIVKQGGVLTPLTTLAFTTEAGYYNATGVKTASSFFTRSVDKIDVSSYDKIFYTGQMGGVASFAICWYNGSTFLSSLKLSPIDGTNQVFSEYVIDKPTNATHIAFTFRTDGNVPYNAKAASKLYATKDLIAAVQTVLNSEVAKTNLMKDKTDQLDPYTIATDTNMLPVLQEGYYDNAGVKVPTSAWLRTASKVELIGFPSVKYELTLYLTGSTASIIFYDASGAVVTFMTNASLGYSIAGLRTIKLDERLTAEQKAVIKYVNVSSYNNGTAVPALKNKSPLLMVANASEVKGLKETLDSVVTIAGSDTYNLGKSFEANRNTLMGNDNAAKPTKIKFGGTSWWGYPCCISVRNTEFPSIGGAGATFFTYVSTEGEQMVARITHPSAGVRIIRIRCVSPAKAYPCDEHNVPAINLLSNDKIIIASAGHYNSTEMEVRIWDDFDDVKPVIKLQAGGNGISYAQILVDGATVMIFTRDVQFRWSVFISRDNGVTWSKRKSFIQGDSGHRAYMKIQKSGEGFAKIYWYPSADERANTFVRYVELNMVTGEILDKVGGTSLGNIYEVFEPISMYAGGTLLYTNAGIADSVSGGNRRLRLLDTSGFERNEACFLVATLQGEPSTVSMNGDYRMITVNLTTMETTSVTLTDYGKEFYESLSDYMGGAFFEQSLFGQRSGNIYLAKWGTQSAVYNPAAANKFRVEKWTANVFNTLIEESATQMYRPFSPQYFSNPQPVRSLYMKGSYINFNTYFTDIIISEV